MANITKAQLTAVTALLSALIPAAKPAKAKAKAAKPKARKVSKSVKLAKAYVFGQDCPFCGSPAAMLAAHPNRTDVLRATFDGCKHSINVKAAQ